VDLNLLNRRSAYEWHIAPHGAMRVPGVIYADEALVRAMDHKVYEQIANVAMLPGIVGASYAMPDAHWGYGFPIGCVAAFDAAEGEALSWSSACHGAGRAMSRRQATKRWQGRKVVDDLAGHGILIRSPSLRGVAEEAPGAYKDVSAVVGVADRAGLARKVARLKPVVCIKG